MSLEGTLETIALPDVLALLSVTAKTGELRIESGGGVGSVWFEAGQVCGFEVGNNKTAVDALFALLRLQEGKFKFHSGTQAVNAMAPEDVAPVLEEAESRLMQWPAIVSVVPSLFSRIALKPTVEGTVMLRPDQWQLVVAIAGGAPVADVIAAEGLGEFDGSKAIKELVDLQLVEVAAGQAAAPASGGLKRAPASLAEAAPPASAYTEGIATPGLPTGSEDDSAWDGEGAREEIADLSEVWGEEPHEVEAAETAPEEGEAAHDPVNRGLLLKFLGSARN